MSLEKCSGGGGIFLHADDIPDLDLLGLSMGSGALFSIYRGKGDERALKSSIAHACGPILAVTLVLNAVVYIFIDPILSFLRVPEEVWGGMESICGSFFAGLLATSLYNSPSPAC